MPSAPTRRAIVSAAPMAILGTALPAAAASPLAGIDDPVFAQIELHRALVRQVNTSPDDDGSPAFQAVADREEEAIQALGSMQPTTIAGAAAQLVYMAEVEGHYAKNGSPLLRTVLSVAQGLASLQGRGAHA